MNGYPISMRLLGPTILAAAVGLMGACSPSDSAPLARSSADAPDETVSIQARLFLVESEAWLRDAGISTSSARVDRLDDLQAKMLGDLADASAEVAMHQVPSVAVDAASDAQRITFRKDATGLADDVAIDLRAQVSISEQTVALTVEPYAVEMSLPNRVTGMICLPLSQENLGTGNERRVAYLLLRPTITLPGLPSGALQP